LNPKKNPLNPNSKHYLKNDFAMMTPKNIVFSAITLFYLLLCACGKEKIALQWTEQVTHTNLELNNIHFRDAQNGIATGGNSWYQSILLKTADGGNTWQSIDTASKLQTFFGCGVSAEGSIFALSFNGYLFRMRPQDTHFMEMRHTWWHTWRDVAFWQDKHGIIVGGQGWQEGRIARLDTDFNVIQLDTFKQELSSVCFSDDSTVHAVGSGTVLRSSNRGKTWVRNALKGDFFRSVCFPNTQIGYTVGSSGTIAKTTDGGISWVKLRDGEALGTSNQPFLNVFFTDVHHGYIVGEGGLCWRTSNGGADWQVMTGLPKRDLHSIFGRDGAGWIAGSEGTILHFVE
jgi:photosystem II stability/assembly factor-like uncharacterized protein